MYPIHQRGGRLCPMFRCGLKSFVPKLPPQAMHSICRPRKPGSSIGTRKTPNAPSTQMGVFNRARQKSGMSEPKGRWYESLHFGYLQSPNESSQTNHTPHTSKYFKKWVARISACLACLFRLVSIADDATDHPLLRGRPVGWWGIWTRIG